MPPVPKGLVTVCPGRPGAERSWARTCSTSRPGAAEALKVGPRGPRHRQGWGSWCPCPEAPGWALGLEPRATLSPTQPHVWGGGSFTRVLLPCTNVFQMCGWAPAGAGPALGGAFPAQRGRAPGHRVSPVPSGDQQSPAQPGLGDAALHMCAPGLPPCLGLEGCELPKGGARPAV